jgi:hypothetical protein
MGRESHSGAHLLSSPPHPNIPNRANRRDVGKRGRHPHLVGRNIHLVLLTTITEGGVRPPSSGEVSISLR